MTTIVCPGGMTRNGRVFAPKNVKPLAKAKGKEIASKPKNSAQNAKSHEGSSSPKAAASQKKVGEFLRIIKKSD